jgi:D-tagatose-1,6-bisphosphate aldolase subunit GatZ/KbaZ
VRDGFAILKVGPALTFAMREALSALSLIEEQLVAARQRSRLMEVVERAMIENPHEWERHYSGDRRTVQLLRRYSYSDRIRYYWNVEPVKSAVSTLMSNLLPMAIPEPLLSAFLPEQYHAVRAGILQSDARSLVIHRIRSVLKPYADACRA